MADSIITPFNPSQSANFQFQASLDGSTYNVVCVWSAYGLRYYVNFYDLTGVLVLSRPLIASPDTANISLTAGYFDTTVVYRDSRAVFEVPGLPPIPAVLPARPPSPPPGRLDPYTGGMLSVFAIYRLLGRDFPYLLQVRRSSDDATMDVGFAAGGETLDVEGMLAFCGSSDGFVSILYDQAKNFNAIAPTMAAQPKIVAAGVYLATIQFDGVDDILISETPVAGTLSAVGLMQFLSLAQFARLYGHLNDASGGEHGTAFNYQPPENKISAYNYGTDGLYKQVLTAGPPDFVMKPYGSVTLSDELPVIWIAGVNATGSILVNDTVTGPFTAQPFAIGGDQGTDFGKINFKSLAIWVNDQTTNMPTLSALM